MSNQVEIKVYFKFDDKTRSEAIIKFNRNDWNKLTNNQQQQVVRVAFFDSYEWSYEVLEQPMRNKTVPAWEFLRVEKIEPVLSDNSVIILVNYSCSYLDAITITNIKADTACFYNLSHLRTDLLLTQREERLLKELGSYRLRAVLGKNKHGIDIWDFELIDFKPLENQ